MIMDTETERTEERGIPVILPPVMSAKDLILQRDPKKIEIVPLPEKTKFPDSLAAQACPWLDEYIKFSSTWSPRGYKHFHESVGVWILSAISARRVYCNLGGRRVGNLFIALACTTSSFTKTGTMRIGTELIHAAGLGHLVMSGDATPQKFIKDRTYHLPEDWEKMSDEAKEIHLLKMAFAGQRSWEYDEFGEKIDAMLRANGAMADYRSLLRKLDGILPTLEYGTIGRGNDVVILPYLSLLASLTDDDLKSHAKQGSTLWGDGFLARWSFAAPAVYEARGRERYPDGERIAPPHLLTPLRQWHERLGYTPARVVERPTETGIRHEIIAVPPPEKEIKITPEIKDAFYNYGDALLDIIEGRPSDLNGNYTRFAEKALRVALLLASFEGCDAIQLHHWARAQQVAENWRYGLHNLYDQVTGNRSDNEKITLEDRIMQHIAEKGPRTRREMTQSLHGVDTETIIKITKSMVEAGVLVVNQTGKAERYFLAPKDS